MKKDDVDEIWAEIDRLRMELAGLKVKRELLQDHAKELKEMHAVLKREADRAEQLAAQAEEIL